MCEAKAELASNGFALIAGPLRSAEEADEVARDLVQACRIESGLLPLSVIGEFVVPPLEVRRSRDFQTLHFDFGLPLDPKVEQDVALYTALHVPHQVADVQAVTRLVPLVPLLAQRPWPPLGELVQRLTSYGRSHGAWDDDRGYIEGSLARVVEAAVAEYPPVLPSVKFERDFLCGMEFESLHAEVRFFERHDLRIHEVEIGMGLRPGEMLVFDNLALAHGRRGTRKPGELRQRIFGHRLHPTAQTELRDRVLTRFHAGRP